MARFFVRPVRNAGGLKRKGQATGQETKRQQSWEVAWKDDAS